MMTDLQDHGDESSYEVPGGMRPLSTDEVFRESSLYSRATRDELPLSTGDMDGAWDTDSGSRGRRAHHSRLSEDKKSSYDEFVSSDKGLLLKTLIDAESAANSAAIQLVSFKDILDDDFGDSRCSSDLRLSRQKGLLLDKLEVFKRINKSVRQQLKELQDQEACRMETDRQIDVLLKRLTQTESENQHLKSNLSDRERRVEELMSLRKKEMENAESVVQQSRSVESTRAHLQNQLRSKEAENNRLTVQLRGLERTVTEQKLEIDDMKGQINAVLEKAAQEKDALKRATRAQKQRAERFEAAMEKGYDQLRDKDVNLAEMRAERDMWKTQHEQIAEEKVHLDTEITILRDQITSLTDELLKEKDAASAANAVLLKKVETLNTENGELGLENATLKASISEYEYKLEHSLTVYQEHSTRSEEKKSQLEQYQIQIAELQTEVTDLRIKLESFLKEKDNIIDGRHAEVAKAREQLESRVLELEACPELLSATEQHLLDTQDNLQRSERKYAERAEALRQHQAKAERQLEKLRSSVEMKDSINEANSQLQEKVESLQKRMEEAHAENRELVHRLGAQEEALHYSSRQLEQRSAECQALSRQLETALTDVRLQVSKVKEKTSTREVNLQARIQELEAEKNRKENELKQLRQSKISSEKQYEVRLKDLQLSLDQSESHKQSIQNYVDFLKNSYSTMFDEGLPSSLGSSYFLK
ncbi:outer dense fiber protein 2-like isoform X1 [Alosa sapidissima]|uniref:outer dense fiber protein 2-like isoform X1 n=2 Tax=Alosa sapidissima TaxID=34773 RepID=UPI001C09A055|nr:outer dense fiber protein 2-like isoform X1 [Alosa sapidissima]XP_041958404.1 outer dense fiber protein 2-like isoform X1 [Alosa sapidissima]